MLLSLICEKLWTDQVIFQLYPARTNSFQIPSEGCPNLVPRRLSTRPLTRFWLRTLTHVNFNQKRGNILSVEIKCEVERGSTFTLTCDSSYTASILFANVKFTYLRT